MKRKVRSRILIALNAAGLACLAVFGIIYLARDTAVRDPGTMIPMTGWEAAGIALTVGFFPLSAVNLLAGAFPFSPIFLPPTLSRLSACFMRKAAVSGKTPSCCTATAEWKS